jgi:hypothetical protein
LVEPQIGAPGRATGVSARGHGWVVAGGIVCAYFALLFALGGHGAWHELGVPARSPTFLDMRSVTTGWECTRRHVDVLPLNPCDPLRRPANYPRIWMKLSVLGLGAGATPYLGLATAVVFLVAALVCFGAAGDAVAGGVYGVAVCSPAVMLGVERGNVDLLIFTLIVASLAALGWERARGLLGAVGLLFAAVLKLFPIFGLGMLLHQEKRRAIVGVVFVAMTFGVYAFATRGDIETIRHVVPQATAHSYGVDISGRWLAEDFPGGRHLYDGLLLGVSIVLGAAVGVMARRGARDGRREAGIRHDLAAFWAGAGIYVGTFALFHGFAYRLVFLLLALPQFFRWARQSSWAIVPIATVLSTLWLHSDGVLAAGAAAQNLLFVCLVAGLVATAPTELLVDLRRGEHRRERDDAAHAR